MPKAASGFLEYEESFESNSWQVCWIQKGQHSTLNLCRYQWELLAALEELLNLAVSLGILCPRLCLIPELPILGSPVKKLRLGGRDGFLLLLLLVIVKLLSAEGLKKMNPKAKNTT